MNQDPPNPDRDPEASEPEDRELELPWASGEAEIPLLRPAETSDKTLPASLSVPPEVQPVQGQPSKTHGLEEELPPPVGDNVDAVREPVSPPNAPPRLDAIVDLYPDDETSAGDKPDASDELDATDELDGFDESTEDLNAAISELEDALNEHATPDTAPLVNEGGEPAQGEQYTIPMLDEVVLPALDQETEHHNHRAEIEALSEGAGAYRPIFERLASEIDVIVQAGVDDALKDASKRILRRVNEHIEIVLPEILDELARKQRDS